MAGNNIVVNALRARSNFGALLRRVEDEGRSLVIEKRGRPRAGLLSIKDYVRLTVTEPEVLRALGRQSQLQRMDKMSSTQIDRVIKSTRKAEQFRQN